MIETLRLIFMFLEFRFMAQKLISIWMFDKIIWVALQNFHFYNFFWFWKFWSIRMINVLKLGKLIRFFLIFLFPFTKLHFWFCFLFIWPLQPYGGEKIQWQFSFEWWMVIEGHGDVYWVQRILGLVTILVF